MRKILFSTVALAALAGQAFAADLPSRKEAPVYVAPAPIFSWTGFYVGADIGGTWGNNNVWAPATNFGASFAHNNNSDGVIGGGFVGYNYQFNNFVIGVQGGIDATSNSNSRWLDPIGRFQTSFGQDWIASIDGRLGWAIWERTLLYAVGGVAWSQQTASVTDNFSGFNLSRSVTRTGYDIGGGVEYAFNYNWTGRIEYRYYNFGNSNTAFLDPLLPVGAYYRTTLTDNVVRAGLAYKFGVPEAVPVVAKY